MIKTIEYKNEPSGWSSLAHSKETIYDKDNNIVGRAEYTNETSGWASLIAKKEYPI